ncbi:MAG TPA: hypothetical protein V6C99_05950 [Oculatellaceae cyanobacterium]|jgi:hypothetical protein
MPGLSVFSWLAGGFPSGSGTKIAEDIRQALAAAGSPLLPWLTEQETANDAEEVS